VGWLAPPAVPGLLAGGVFTVFGLPNCLLQWGRGETELMNAWPILLAPVSIWPCLLIIRTSTNFQTQARVAERMEQEYEEKIVLPRQLTMNLRERSTPEDLPLEGEGSASGTDGTPPSDLPAER
jgi:hypothetical protein